MFVQRTNRNRAELACLFLWLIVRGSRQLASIVPQTGAFPDHTDEPHPVILPVDDHPTVRNRSCTWPHIDLGRKGVALPTVWEKSPDIIHAPRTETVVDPLHGHVV